MRYGMKLLIRSASDLPYCFNRKAIATWGSDLKSEYSPGALVSYLVIMYLMISSWLVRMALLMSLK